MHRGRWNDQAGDEEEMEALPWPPRTFSSTDPSHYALGASSSSPYASFSPPSPAERYFQRSGGGALRGTPPYSASSSPPYSSPRPPLLHPRPLLPSTPYAYTSFSPPPFLQAQPSAFPLRPPPLHGLPPRSAPLPAHSSLPSRPTAHGHQHSSSFPPYLPHQGSGVNSTGLRDGNGRIQRVGRRSSRDDTFSFTPVLASGSRSPAAPMSLRSHESIYSTWSPASPTFSNASISTSGQYGEDEGPVSPRSISLAPYEDDERLHSIFVAYITYLCDHTDATTSTGEVIAQPLMATKTARFDRAGEFRPFRFRIQAFTTGFAEWLHEEQQRHGGPTIALPRLREFIWSHLYIVRYTHEGKKSKSKGNHIWTLESRLLPTHQRVFRPFYRTILPPTALRAQVGLEWHYLPKLWDPRASLSDVKVVWDSPGGLPGWMRWEAGVLRGVPREERNEVIGVRGRMGGEKGVEEFERRFELVVVGRGRG